MLLNIKSKPFSSVHAEVLLLNETGAAVRFTELAWG